MKKILFIFLVIQLSLLSSCTSGEPVDQETLNDILSSLEINTDLIMVNSIFMQGDISMDQIEVVDMSNRDEVLIHIMYNSDNAIYNRDEMFMITSNWLYSTQNMRKTSLAIDPYDDDVLYTVISSLTLLIDFEFLKREQIIDLVNSLDEPELIKNGSTYTLRGRIPTSEVLDDDVIKICEIVYKDHVLVGLNVQYEHTFRSTMQQSNYISGIHYYFGEEMIGEFPALNAFS